MTTLALLQAASIGDLQEVHKLLKAGHKIDECGPPLTKDELKKLRWLVNEAGVNEAASAMEQPFDYTPLMAALAEGHFEVAEALLDAGADHNAVDSLKRTPLMLAIDWKQEALAKKLIALGVDVNIKDLSGSPVLTQAIESSAWPVVHALLDAGANAQPIAKQDCLPLSAALYESGDDASSVVLRLMEAGARIDDPELLGIVAGNHNDQVVATMLDAITESGSEFSADELLRQAAKQRKLSTLKLLVERGVRPTNSENESSPLVDLIIGPARSHTDFYKEEFIDDEREVACLEVLVEAGADVNHTVEKHGYPLHWAVRFYRSALCRRLLEYGADPNLCEHDGSALDVAREKLEKAMPKYELKPKEAKDFKRLETEARQIVDLLEEYGGRSAAPESRLDSAEEDDEDTESECPVLAIPVAERRGLCDATFFKARQIMMKAEIDKIADAFEKDKAFIRVDRDVYSRLKELEPHAGDLLALVKLKGQPWVYLAGGRRPRGDSPMKALSKKLRAPVLYAGEESVAGVVFYALYDGGKCVEAFESDGVWFTGGVEIDPEVQEESDRMVGTSFSSQLRDTEEMDWSAYKSEWDFLERFLREHDAYLTFMWAGSSADGKTIEIASYHEDEAAAEAIERLDLVYYKPTAQQQQAAKAPSQKEDPLYEAIKAGNLDAVKHAIDAGINLNQLPPRDNSSYLVSALGCALYHRSQQIVDLLLQSGADANFSGSEPPLPRLLASPSRETDQMEMALKLLAAGADIDGRKSPDNSNPFAITGETSLHKVAQRGRINFVKLLLRHGADTSLVDGIGRTPIDAARAWLKAVKEDQIKALPTFTTKLDLANAQETVDHLQAAERGELDLATLPTDAELIEAEAQLQAERRRQEDDDS